VAEWKALYADLSAQIRVQKREAREAHRNGTFDYRMGRQMTESKRTARGLLALRRAAKRDSWAKRQALRAAA
jgi:hypothetical protein